MLHRYGSKKERESNRIPDGIKVRMRLNGQPKYFDRVIDGKYRFHFTDGALEVIDTAGAGVVESTPIGMVRFFSAEALEEPC